MEEAKARFREAILFHLEGIDAKVRENNLPEPRLRAEVVAVEEDDFIDGDLVEIKMAAQ